MDFAFSPEQDELIRTLRGFARKELQPRSAHWDKSGEFPWEAFRQMGELGLLGLRIPAAHGGQDSDYLTFGIAMEEIARGDFAGHFPISKMPLLRSRIGARSTAVDLTEFYLR